MAMTFIACFGLTMVYWVFKNSSKNYSQTIMKRYRNKEIRDREIANIDFIMVWWNPQASPK